MKSDIQLTDSASAENIPLVAVPVLNRGDLLKRFVQSIDERVDRLLIINNGRDEEVARAIECWQKERLDLVGELTVVTPRRNIGVAASWNVALKFMMMEALPYLVISGSDICLGPGDLSKIRESYQMDVGIKYGDLGYSLFMMTPMAIEAAGIFDENFYPAYLEDCDYDYRLRLSGPMVGTISNLGAIHGTEAMQGSCTIHSNSELLRLNSITHTRNNDYYCRKWGGSNGREVFVHPFNRPNVPIDWWELEVDHVLANSIWPDV